MVAAMRPARSPQPGSKPFSRMRFSRVAAGAAGGLSFSQACMACSAGKKAAKSGRIAPFTSNCCSL